DRMKFPELERVVVIESFSGMKIASIWGGAPKKTGLRFVLKGNSRAQISGHFHQAQADGNHHDCQYSCSPAGVLRFRDL
ncbi:MAG: hypothetical protein ACLPRE_12570, partial [Limisphaerales bacterium]